MLLCQVLVKENQVKKASIDENNKSGKKKKRLSMSLSTQQSKKTKLDVHESQSALINDSTVSEKRKTNEKTTCLNSDENQLNQ